MQTLKKQEKYLDPVLVVVALMMKPIPAMVAGMATNGPRILYRSESQQMAMTMKKQKT